LDAVAGTAPSIIEAIIAAADASTAFISLAQPVVGPACRMRYRPGNPLIAVWRQWHQCRRLDPAWGVRYPRLPSGVATREAVPRPVRLEAQDTSLSRW
jgi:hypothetical protein